MSMDPIVMGAVLAVVLALVEVIKTLVSRRAANGSRAAIYDTDRRTQQLVSIARQQTEILNDVRTTLAIMRDRECPIGRRNNVGGG